VACAGRALVDTRRCGDHPVHGKAFRHAREAGLSHPCSQRFVLQRAGHGLGKRAGVVRRHQQSGDPVGHDLGNAAGPGGDDRPRAGHRVEQRRAQAFGDRAHGEQVERFQAADDVGAETGKEHVTLKMPIADQPLERGAQLAFAEDDEPDVRHPLDEKVRRVDEIPVSLVRHQRGDVADDGAAVRQRERGVQVDRRGGSDGVHVDAFVNGHDPLRRHAVADQHLANGIGCRDEAIDLAVLPAREGIALEVKIDAPRRDERRRASTLDRCGAEG